MSRGFLVHVYGYAVLLLCCIDLWGLMPPLHACSVLWRLRMHVGGRKLVLSMCRAQSCWEPMNLSKLPHCGLHLKRRWCQGGGCQEFADRSSTACHMFAVPVKSTEHVCCSWLLQKKMISSDTAARYPGAGWELQFSHTGSQPAWNLVSLSGVFFAVLDDKSASLPHQRVLRRWGGIGADDTGAWFWDDGSAGGEGSCFYWVWSREQSCVRELVGSCHLGLSLLSRRKLVDWVWRCCWPEMVICMDWIFSLVLNQCSVIFISFPLDLGESG